MTEEAIGSLSAEEQAYFSSRGEADVKPETAPVVDAVVDPDVEAELAETDDDAVAQAAVEGQPKKLVPLAALTKERQSAKELKARLAEFEKRDAVWQDRWSRILQDNQPEQKPVDDDPEPDRNQDIFKHNEWLSRQLGKVKETVAAKANEEAKAKEAQAAETQIWSRWESDGRAYIQENPDFGNAAKWLSDYRDKQLTALSVVDPRFADPNMRNWQIEQELKQIVVGSAQGGKSSAQVIYDIAKGYGYTAQAAAPTAEQAVAALTKTEQNIDASASLSSVSGSRPSGAVDPKTIANMSSAEFEAWYAKHGEKAFRKMAGG